MGSRRSPAAAGGDPPDLLGGASGARWVLALVSGDRGHAPNRPGMGWLARELAAVVWIPAAAVDDQRRGRRAAEALARAVRG